MLRIIFGGISDNGNWRRRYNFELDKLFGDVDALKFINLNRMRWAGHIMRMEHDRAILRVFNSVPFGQRQGVGRKRDGLTVWTPILALLR